MTVYCITQARMNSNRLPGKVLKKINGLPLIDYHMKRVGLSKLIDQHILATSNTLADEPLVDYCTNNQYSYFCGSETDVLKRFYLTAKNAGAKSNDLIIRLTGDCPLICPELIDEVITVHKNNSAQYTRIDLDFYPRGFDVELFLMAALDNAQSKATEDYQREHVTPFIISNLPSEHITNISSGNKNWSKIRLCVDELNDFKIVQKVIKYFGDKIYTTNYKTICGYLLDNPDLLKINSSVNQKTAP